jgi:hypothetical protein
MQERKINPITNQEVDEIIKEQEAKQRGFFEFEFLMRYLEDENEYVKYYIVNGKKIVVDMSKPVTQYKKPLNLNYERVLQTEKIREENVNPVAVCPTALCNLDDEDCISCSG